LAKCENKLGDPDLPVVLDSADTANIRIYMQNIPDASSDTQLAFLGPSQMGTPCRRTDYNSFKLALLS